MTARSNSENSFLFAENAVFIEEMYQAYCNDSLSVDQQWREFFDIVYDAKSITSSRTTAKVIALSEIKNAQLTNQTLQSNVQLRNSILRILEAYRSRGHYLTKLDPLAREPIKSKTDLSLNIENFSLSLQTLSDTVAIRSILPNFLSNNLHDFIQELEKVYTNTIAVEFNHVQDLQRQEWLYDQFENMQLNVHYEKVEQCALLKDLVEIAGFEQYLHIKFPGAKRFSIEGADSAIAAIARIVNTASSYYIAEIIMGMTHRGRLCALSKILQKPIRTILSEFKDNNLASNELRATGDVKYHMGYSAEYINTDGSKLHISLLSNPSHLESINPVVAGTMRARQELIQDFTRKKVLGILVHGDTAFCGQGIVAESFAMSNLEPYDVGGIIHIVIDNQIGFTANSCDSRCGRYATEFAKIAEAPIMHVNGDDAEAVMRATTIAMCYRQRFGSDVVIDIKCYRKYGHNESDEPMYTQSSMYNIIKNKEPPAAIYANQLIKNGVIDKEYYTKLQAEFRAAMDIEYAAANYYKPSNYKFQELWQEYDGADEITPITGVAKKTLQELGVKLCTIPTEFAIHAKLQKLFEHRATTLKNDEPIDWATSEQLAFASLLMQGTQIRFTGQDSSRGAFAHRHAVLHSQNHDIKFLPLNNISDAQAKCFIADSNLSEYGVLGFEYGYSLVDSRNLVIWEAQFGDFANGAQIIFDQFIASGEAKWQQMSGLVVLLPHGLDGQGPEHSSSRLERFLAMAAENNMRIAYPTTPASIFHLLRRQVVENIRKPLIVMTPKSLLRHKLALSQLTDLDEGTSFIPVLAEINQDIDPGSVKRIIFCTGKVYYDLLEMRIAYNIIDTAIIRFEQLYPFAEKAVNDILKSYRVVNQIIWCQEEPQNMGAWSFIRNYLQYSLSKVGINEDLQYIGREAAASPAVGSLLLHTQQQKLLLTKALAIQ